MLPQAECQVSLIKDAIGGYYSIGRETPLHQVVQCQVGQREHSVTSIDCLCLAPQRPYGGTAATSVAPVLDVVVDQREVVDQFDSGGGRKGMLGISPGGLTSQQREQGAQALARFHLGRSKLIICPA